MMNPGVYTQEPTLAELLTGLMHDARALLRQEVALATHEVRTEIRTTMRAVMSLGIGVGLAAVGGWLLTLMLVHVLHTLPVLPLWACYGIVGGLFAVVGGVLLVLGKQKLARIHVAPRGTVETMKDNVRWVKRQVMTNGRSTNGGAR